MTFLIKFGMSFLLVLAVMIYRNLTANRTTYINAPEEIISSTLAARIQLIGVFIPTFTLTIILTIKIIPNYSPVLAGLVRKDSEMVWCWAVPIFLIVGLVMVFIVEGVLEFLYPEYRRYKSKFL